MTIRPLPIVAALEWFGNAEERTEERLHSLIDHFCTTMAFPVTEEHRAEAVECCKARYWDFRQRQ